MARYFFHFCDGQDTLIDEDGKELGSLDAVKSVALREARALVSQEALQGKIELNQSIEVRDAEGAVVHTLQFRDAVSVSG